MAALFAWLSAQCDGFWNRVSVVALPTTAADVTDSFWSCDELNARTSLTLVATSLVDTTVSPFSVEVPSFPTVSLVLVPPVVSNPFVD